MEALNCLINRAVREGFLTDYRIRRTGGSGIQVSHLLFADDTLVFCEDSQEKMAFLSLLLMWFEVISGLSINLNKSELLPVGRVESVEVLAAELGCKVGSLPSTYLGLLKVLLISRWQCGMVWKRGCGRDLPCGRGSSFPRGGDSLSFGARWLACRSISCPCCLCQELLD